MILELFARVVNVVSSPMNRQEALLAAISEKDANIALLELSSSKKKKTQEEVAQLKREKDRLVQQLKQQVGKGRFIFSCRNDSYLGGVTTNANVHIFPTCQRRSLLCVLYGSISHAGFLK